MRASGGIYNGVPTLYLVLISEWEVIAKPKSAIFHLLPERRMLAGFRSLWMILLEHKYL